MNPYTPPASPIKPDDDGRPPEVVRAVRLLWIYLALLLPSLWITATVGITELLIGLPVLAVLLLLPPGMGRGSNVARVAVILLYVITTRLTIGSLMQATTSSGSGRETILLIVPVIQTIPGGMSLFYVLTQPGRSWFNRRH
jgi:hypothetical protein